MGKPLGTRENKPKTFCVVLFVSSNFQWIREIKYLNISAARQLNSLKFMKLTTPHKTFPA